MPIVRRGNIDKAGGIGSVRCQGEDVHGGSRMMAGDYFSRLLDLSTYSSDHYSNFRLRETSTSEPAGASIDPLEFGPLLPSQGTFLVGSASVRDVLGWGTSEVIGRSIYGMARDSRSGMGERVEAELAKFDTLEVCLFPFRFPS
jgi:hypothetical protein